MEIRVARASGAWELDGLVHLAAEIERIQDGKAFSSGEGGVLAMGHGGPRGVHNHQGAFVLTPEDAQTFPGWAHAMACQTAPDFIGAFVEAGADRAGGYTEELRLPMDLQSCVGPDLTALAAYVLAITEAVALGPDRATIENRVYQAQKVLFDAWQEQTSFLLVGFAEQLREALDVSFGTRSPISC